MVDFKKKLSKGTVERKTNPIDLYQTLDRKSVAGPLRPAQEYILSEWYEKHKNDRDLIIKLHTGEGKTLIGLLALQSMINSNDGPCAYVCPNIYLVKQVCLEAQKFGIPFCVIDNKNNVPDEFFLGERILITHAQKIFNGRSVFGIDNNCINIGTIVLDDSHACIDVIKNAFTISISKTDSKELYEKFITLFGEDLKEQGEGSFMDLLQGDYETFMPVPYWSWLEKKSEALSILSDFCNIDKIKYVWPLIRDKINEYECFISGSKIEISPYNPNVEVFGSFSNAKRRILMSATTQDDSFFIKGLSFSINAVKNPLINLDQKWSGERMLILPSLINEDCDQGLISAYFTKRNFNDFGVVALVPSTKKAKYYNDLGAIVTDTNNIFENVLNLKKGEFSKIVVINNRYDGIDLPDECCRILIIDSMPYFDSLTDRYEEKCRPNSEIINKRIAQKIEQGMGRGVRGEKDYCATLIIGSDIVKFMRSVLTNKYFSAQTCKQIEIGLEIAKMAKEEQEEGDKSIKQIISLIRQMLIRDEGWKEYYNTEMDKLKDNEENFNMYESLLEEFRLERLYSSGELEKACEGIQRIIDNIKDNILEKGWYLQQLARYTYPLSKENSINLQKAAFKSNSQLLKPKSGIIYTKVSYISENRLNRIHNFLNSFKSFNEVVLAIDETLDNLSFGVYYDKFEGALKTVGELLGFVSQRPDQEIRKGPDNLWCCSNNEYLFFECKNEVSESRGEISKYESGQMNSHCAWFEEEYGEDARVKRFMIIPTKDLSYYGDFSHDVRIIRKGKLNILKNNIKAFIKELKNYEISEVTDESLQRFLDIHHLNMIDFETMYSENYYHKKE